MFLVVGANGVIVASYTVAEVAFIIAQLVGLWMVAQPGEFEAEGSDTVGQINEDKRAVGSLFARGFVQAQCVTIESYAALQVGDVDIAMVESCFNFHIVFVTSFFNMLVATSYKLLATSCLLSYACGFTMNL